MKISIIVLNSNGLANTRDCLFSLQKLKSDAALEIIVVDNASTDDSVVQLARDFPGVTLIKNKHNLGFSEGNNVAIRQALVHKADFILLLNNDTTVHPQLIQELLFGARQHEKGGLFSPKIYFAPGFETHASRYKAADLGKVIWYAGGVIDWDNVFASHRGVDEVDTGQYDEVIKTAFATGCALFVRREVFEKVGLLDAKFYLYFEDLDFSQRARKKGYEIYYIPKAIVWHKNASSAGGTGSELQSYYMTRNRLLVGMRYSPWRTKLALLREAMNVTMSGTPTQRYAIGDFLRKKYGRREDFWLTSYLPTITIPTIQLPHMPPMPNLFKYFRKKQTKTIEKP